MRVFNVKRLAMGATALTALIGLGMGAASATPTFQITPNALGVTGYTPQTESDVLGSSDSTVTQSGATTETETGWLQMQTFTNNGAGSSFKQTGLQPEDSSGTAVLPNTYGLYLTFQGVVTGVTGTTAGQTGIIAPGAFTFAWHADLGDNDIFNAGNNTGLNPTVTDTGANDVVLAIGTSIGTGNAGFQSGTGAPIFSATAEVILCDGTASQGTFQGKTVTATGCGTFDATKYFSEPVPFYAFQFSAATSGSAGDVSGIGAGGAFTINGIGADINFANIPEPISISLFGAGLAGAAFVRRRKAKKA